MVSITKEPLIIAIGYGGIKAKELRRCFAATTIEMKCNTTYTGWDFVGIWFIYNGVEYPVLRWQGNYEGEDMGSCEGVVEGTTEGTVEGEGVVEGTVEGTVEGVVEGTTEGTVEGVIEGTQEGTHEGTTEGSIEGTHEGTVEGTTEGITEGEGATEPECGCGCDSSNKDLFDNFWKHLFDFITVGLLLSLMSGMYIKRK
jgi:hypothetical protein